MQTKQPTSTYYIETLADWEKIAPLLYQQAQNTHVWCFKGHLGAGKTTLIKALCRHLGVQTPITSPTYSLIHEYPTPHPYKIYHMDFYRLKTATEALNIGFESYLTHQDYIFIEWPEIIQPLLPPHCFHIQINILTPPKRSITVHFGNAQL